MPQPRAALEAAPDPSNAGSLAGSDEPDDDPEAALTTALRQAPDDGASVPNLIAATGMGRTWVYDRLQERATDSRAVQVSRGRWRDPRPADCTATSEGDPADGESRECVERPRH